ncbi:MAG: prolyl aminopeptidase [Candidatus Levyibacteriota bacterium]
MAIATHIIKSGFLPVGDGHNLYYEQWGNQNAAPIFYLHGGPGSGFSDGNKLLFDPAKHHVIFHDQRGSGRSTPSASLEQNTTQNLIEDINKLAEHLRIDSFIVVGGSWGSTLSLLYAIANPKRVQKLVVWSICLVRKFETDYVNGGYPRYSFPEAWERFISFVPEKHRTNGDKIMEYYAQQIRSTEKNTASKFAGEWILWEASLLSKNYDQRRLEAEILSIDTLPMAMLETHYFLNNCFIPENYILDNITKIQHIPAFIVHGRFDFCTPPIAARDLAKAYGKSSILQWTNAGHLRTDPENFVVLKAIINAIA